MGSNGQQPRLLSEVDPRAIVAQLANQIAGMAQLLAMKDAYIEQLHQALTQVAEASAD